MMPYSYQLYSSRNFGPIAQTLKMLKAAGYGAVEGFGGLYADQSGIDALKAALSDTGLKMRTAHVGLDALESAPQETAALMQDLGVERVYMPFIMPQDRPTSAAGWHTYGRRVETAGQPLRDAGIGFGYHNHDFELVPVDGEIPMDALLEGGSALEWEIDVAWVIKGGADPLAWIDRYKDRITAVHVKDIAAPGENADEDGWADVGHGTMDWPGLMTALKATPAQHFIMEHDNPSDDARFAANAIAALSA